MHSSRSKAKPAPSRTTYRLQFEAIGTHWRIDMVLLQENDAAKLEAVIHDRIEEFDAVYSRFRNDSLVRRMARQAGTYALPDDAQPLFDLYRRLYQSTDGAMTPLIGQTMVDAGYDASYSLVPKPLSSPRRWEEVLHYDFPRLVIHTPVLLDVGAAGKGYLVDIVGELLESHGVHDYCIDAGGDIRHRTTDNGVLAVGLEHPTDAGQAVGIAHVGNASICGSAGNRRAWGEYHHIIDPRTLRSPRHVQAIWTVAASTLWSDGLSTALFFTSADHLRAEYAFEYALIHADGALERSPGFPAEFFIRESL